MSAESERSGFGLLVEDPRLLLVEDEDHLATGLKLNFELEGFHVDIARSGRDAARLLVQPQGFDVIVLDVMLPDVDDAEGLDDFCSYDTAAPLIETEYAAIQAHYDRNFDLQPSTARGG
jgi:DNA-binding NtrC family response regulator